MKYTIDIIINAPRSEVIRLFDNTENMYKWQPDLQSFEHISGEPGQEGSKSRLIYDMNGKEIEMIETITKRNLPDEFNGTYEAKGVFNHQVNRFEDLGEKTRWTTVSEFRFTGVYALFFPLMKGSFKKQTCSYLERFKDFVESEL